MARRTFPGIFDPRRSSLRGSFKYRTVGGVQKKEVRQHRDQWAGILSRRYTIWVVAYNPTLMRMFHCHMNVELCVSRIGAISASEAAWRILAFDIEDNDPTIYRLEVHTEGHHTV